MSVRAYIHRATDVLFVPQVRVTVSLAPAEGIVFRFRRTSADKIPGGANTALAAMCRWRKHIIHT